MTDLATLRTRIANLEAKRQRALGRQQAAREELRAVEEDCLRKNIQPDKLPEKIVQLENKLSEAIAQLEQQTIAAERALSPFLEE